MRKLVLAVVAVGSVFVIAGCGGGGASCAEVCEKLVNECDLLPVSVEDCVAGCENDSTGDERDCVNDKSCEQIAAGECN